MSSIMKGIVDEEVGGNYLYHSVQDADTAKAILSSGYFMANRSSSQPATDAQTQYPVVSFGRNINYQTNGANVRRDYQVVFVIDRRKLEANYKTLGTSQSHDVRNAPYAKEVDPEWMRKSKMFLNKFDSNKNGKIDYDEISDPSLGIGAQNIKKFLYTPKAGGEFEEAVPVKSGKLPLKGILLGFYLVPGKAASKDQELVNNPLRLDMPKPNIFVKAKPAEPVSETEAKKGADGKRCWKGKRYAGTVNGKDKCIPVDEAGSAAQQAAIAVNMKKKGQKPKHVDEAKAKQYVKPFMQDGKQVGWKSSDGYHVKYWQMFAKDSAIKHAKLNPDEVQEDYTEQFAAEKTPTVNPHAGVKERQFRGAIGEEPSSPVGEQPGGWRTYKPKSAGDIEEDTAYAGGMGQGGNAGESYRKFTPKSAGTFKESAIMKGILGRD